MRWSENQYGMGKETRNFLHQFCRHRLSVVAFDLSPRCPQVVWCHRGEIAPFSVTLAQDGLAKVISQGKILSHGWELNPGHREDRQWDTSILPLSYHDPGCGEDRRWVSFILPLSYHDPGHEEDKQWDTFILPLSYHGRMNVSHCLSSPWPWFNSQPWQGISRDSSLAVHILQLVLSHHGTKWLNLPLNGEDEDWSPTTVPFINLLSVDRGEMMAYSPSNRGLG